MEDHAATNVSVNGMFHIEQSVLSLSAVSTTLLAFLLLSTVLQPHAVMPLLLGTWRPSLSVNVFYPLNTQHKPRQHAAHTHTHLTALFLGLPRWAGTRIWILLKQETVSGSGWESASLHLAPDRQPHQHTTTLLFTGRMPFLPSNQQRQSTEGTTYCSCGQMVEQTDGPTVTRFMHPVRHTMQSVSTIWVTIDWLSIFVCMFFFAW